MQSIEGLKITHAWRGFGSAIFLEFGAVTMERRGHHPRGEATLMIQWSWRIEGARAIRAGSASSDRLIRTTLAALKGLRVRRIQLEGHLPELSVELARGTWVRSFTTAEGQPEWALFLRDRSWLCVEGGKVVQGRPTSRRRLQKSATS